jgi:hypothetical protein
LNCKYCQNPIGLFRSLKDREFCSAAHRAAGGKRSARALRELGELDYSTVASWDGTDEPVSTAAPNQSSNVRSTATVLALVALGGVLVLSLDPPSGAPTPSPNESTKSRPGWLAQQTNSLLNHLPKGTPGIELRQDFVSEGFRGWQAASNAAAGWSIDNGLLRPGGLRIWRDSRQLADYRFQFEGRIENTSLNWAVRAGDHRNYYASKLMVSGRGSSKATEIVRFSVIGGKESRRVRLPLPITLDDKAFYHYEVRALDDRFVTIVGGKVIDTFRDTRLKSGGVGFFSEGSEKASIRWAKVVVGEDFVEKLRGFLTFGLILPPLD